MDNLFYYLRISMQLLFNFIIYSHNKKLHLLFVQEIKDHMISSALKSRIFYF